MSVTVTHAFTSTKSQGGDASIVSKNEWNAAHVVTGALENPMTTAGDMIYTPATTNYATVAQGASQNFDGNTGPANGYIDQNDTTYNEVWGFASGYYRIDLGQVRAVGSMRFVTNGSTYLYAQYSSDNSNWFNVPEVQGLAVGGGSPHVTTVSIATLSYRYWRCSGSSNGWDLYTWELNSALVASRLPVGTSGTVITSDGNQPVYTSPFDATAPVTQAFGDTAATGSATTSAHRDHKHGMPASPVSPSASAAALVAAYNLFR